MAEYKTRRRKKGEKAGNSIPATEAAKTFGRLVDRVREEGVTYIVERHGHPVAQIGPVEPAKSHTLSSFAQYMKTAPRLDEEVLRYIEEAVAEFNRPAVPDDPWER